MVTQSNRVTDMLVQQGALSREQADQAEALAQRNGKKVKVGRLVRMHANEMEDIEDACAGDIVALFGVDCFSGDTFTDGTVDLAMTSIHVPDAVISLTITPKDGPSQINMSKALQRFSKEDPTFRVSADPETGETIIAGMGELHLEIIVDRLKREFWNPMRTQGCQMRSLTSSLAVSNYPERDVSEQDTPL